MPGEAVESVRWIADSRIFGLKIFVMVEGNWTTLSNRDGDRNTGSVLHFVASQSPLKILVEVRSRHTEL